MGTCTDIEEVWDELALLLLPETEGLGEATDVVEEKDDVAVPDDVVCAVEALLAVEDVDATLGRPGRVLEVGFLAICLCCGGDDGVSSVLLVGARRGAVVGD